MGPTEEWFRPFTPKFGTRPNNKNEIKSDMGRQQIALLLRFRKQPNYSRSKYKGATWDCFILWRKNETRKKLKY